jgi:hypothetical protein
MDPPFLDEEETGFLVLNFMEKLVEIRDTDLPKYRTAFVFQRLVVQCVCIFAHPVTGINGWIFSILIRSGNDVSPGN